MIWHRHTKEDNFIPGRVIELRGDYQMWMKGPKVAISNIEDNASKDLKIRRAGIRGAFNGVDWRETENVPSPRRIAIGNQPHFMRNTNWFDIVGWRKPSMLEIVRDTPLDTAKVVEWSFEESPGERLWRVVWSDPEGGRRTQYYNVDKGCCLERDEHRNAQGQLTVETVSKIAEVSKGFWLPVEVRERVIHPSGKDSLINQFVVDLKNSSFGEPSSIPDSVFDLAIAPNMRVSDYRGGEPILYTGAARPLSKAELQVVAKRFVGKAVDVSGDLLPRPWQAYLWLSAASGLILIALGLLMYWRRRKRLARAHG